MKDYIICEHAKDILFNNLYDIDVYGTNAKYLINDDNWNKFINHIASCEICTLKHIKKDFPLVNMFISLNKVKRLNKNG